MCGWSIAGLDLALAPEALAEQTIVAQMRRQDLERDGAVERQLRGLVDDSHAALPEDPGYLVRGRRRCTRYQQSGTLTRRNRPKGRNLVRFSGRIGIKPLPRGRHRVTVSATDAAGNRSKRKRTSFTIVRK